MSKPPLGLSARCPPDCTCGCCVEARQVRPYCDDCGGETECTCPEPVKAHDPRPDRAQCPQCGYMVLWDDADHAAEEWREGCPRCGTEWDAKLAKEVNRE